MQSIYQRYRLFQCGPGTRFTVKISWNAPDQIIRFETPEINDKNGITYMCGSHYTGIIDISENNALLTANVSNPLEAVDYFLRILYANLIFYKGGLMLHGAGIVRNQCGYLFFGHSGSGKTTISRASLKDQVLNDDLVVMIPKADDWLLCSTPFWNPTQIEPKPLTGHLTALYHLAHDQKVYLEPLKASGAIAEMISNIPIIASDPLRSSVLFDRCLQIMLDHPVFRLHFLPDDSFWHVITGY